MARCGKTGRGVSTAFGLVGAEDRAFRRQASPRDEGGGESQFEFNKLDPPP
jgi:hypothetical protein